MSAELELILHAAPLAAMLSVSTSTVMPLSRSPYHSKTLTMPNNSLQLIGLLFSALVNCSLYSSRPPSMKTACPVPQSLASVPVIAASPATLVTRLMLLRLLM